MKVSKAVMERALRACDNDELAGFCLTCSAEFQPLEGDAREELCENCGAASVYGAEEIVLMGEVENGQV